MSGKTLYDKIWEAHLVKERDDGTALIYIDRHLIHEVTSPQAFEGLRLSGRSPWRTDANLAVPDHNIPTTKEERSRGLAGIKDPVSKIQVETLTKNCREFKILELEMNDVRQGIVHVVGPEQGATLPGMTIVCGDSHTSTHGALGALAHGIGTSEVEHVLATQCLMQKKMKNMMVKVNGCLKTGVTAKDVVLAIIGEIGTAGGTGYTIEFGGEAIEALSIEGRMTVCNMAIEAGARAGLIAVDEKTIEYIKGRPFAPVGELWVQAIEAWKDLSSDLDAKFDRLVELDAARIEPQVTWGTSPEMVASVNGRIPDPADEADSTKRASIEQALNYMGLEGGTLIKDIKLDYIFIGSCTNSRIEDLREAARIVEGKSIADNVEVAMVVPGSGLVKQQAEEEGLHEVFIDAGLQWREPGCSMCLAMNADQLGRGKHCASTSNRNFEGRQGFGGRTHLVSPAMAAAAAVYGHFCDVREVD